MLWKLNRKQLNTHVKYILYMFLSIQSWDLPHNTLLPERGGELTIFCCSFTFTYTFPPALWLVSKCRNSTLNNSSLCVSPFLFYEHFSYTKVLPMLMFPTLLYALLDSRLQEANVNVQYVTLLAFKKYLMMY